MSRNQEDDPLILRATRRHHQNRISKHADVNEIIAEKKGERFREYRRRFHASGRGELQLDFPLDLSIETVDFCNYACPYCPRIDDAGSSARLPEDWFQTLVTEFATRTQGLGAIGFDRGEPFVDRHLEHKIKYINEQGVLDTIVTTNGVFLTPSRAAAIVESGLTKLHVSIDAATQDTYTKTRGGNLAKVEENVEAFVRIRDEMGSVTPIVRVSFVVCDLNRHEIEMFTNKWATLVDYVEFQDCIDHSRMESLPDFPVEPFWCQYPFQSVSVTAKGKIMPCCSFYNKHLVFGHVGEGDTIEQVFNDPRSERLRTSFREKKDYDVVCKNCRCTPPADSGVVYVGPLLKPVAGPPRGKT